jgi:hypothetical protein
MSKQIISESYIKSLNDLKNAIPEDYSLKEELSKSIENAIENLLYKAPEVLSESFRKYCLRIMNYLPKKNNEWALEKWNDICNVAKKNNSFIKNNY